MTPDKYNKNDSLNILSVLTGIVQLNDPLLLFRD